MNDQQKYSGPAERVHSPNQPTPCRRRRTFAGLPLADGDYDDWAVNWAISPYRGRPWTPPGTIVVDGISIVPDLPRQAETIARATGAVSAEVVVERSDTVLVFGRPVSRAAARAMGAIDPATGELYTAADSQPVARGEWTRPGSRAEVNDRIAATFDRVQRLRHLSDAARDALSLT